MEFLRFGSSIPGSYWGCCAMDIIQNFKVYPDAKVSIQIVNGDGGTPQTNSKGQALFVGMTYKEVFLHRLRFGTFSTSNMPNHGFLAILTQWQLENSPGKEWLEILKEQGFEFIRTVDNSVYSGDYTIKEAGEGCTSAHPNYLFGLFRNIGNGAIKDPFTPPKAWTDLAAVVPEAWENIPDGVELNTAVQKVQLEVYKKLPSSKFYTEDEVEKAGVTVTYAGLRSLRPQETKSKRQSKEGKDKLIKTKSNAFPAPVSASVSIPVTASA